MGERDDGQGLMSPEVAVMVLQTELEQSPARVAEAVSTLAGLVSSVMASPYGDVVDSDGRPMSWHFVGYRPDAAALGKHSADTLNAPELPQYQGVIFADGTCVLRWLTAKRSWSVWDSFAEMFTVHGHPEYGTRIVWPTGDAPADALEVIATAVEELERKRAAEAAEPATAGGVPLEERHTELEHQRGGWSVGSLGELTEEQLLEVPEGTQHAEDGDR